MSSNDSGSAPLPSLPQIETLVAALADLMQADAVRLSVEMRSFGIHPPHAATTPIQEETGAREPTAQASRIEGARAIASGDLLTVTDAALRSSFYAVPNDPHDGPSATALFFLLPDPRD